MTRGRKKSCDSKNEIISIRLTKKQKIFLDNNDDIRKIMIKKFREDIDKIQETFLNE